MYITAVQRFIHFLLRYRAGQGVVRWALSVLRMLCRNDLSYLLFLRWCMRSSFPAAASMLGHYLSGSGKLVPVSTHELLLQDAGGRLRLAEELARAEKSGNPYGTFSMPQWQFANLERRLSLGSMCVDWTKSGAGWEIACRGLYRWSPDELRITQSIHRAAKNCERVGAREFAFAGFPVRLERPMSVHLSVPSDRLYL